MYLHTLVRVENPCNDSINLFHGRLPEITSTSIQPSPAFTMPGDVQAAAYQRSVEALVSKLRRRYGIQKKKRHLKQLAQALTYI